MARLAAWVFTAVLMTGVALPVQAGTLAGRDDAQVEAQLRRYFATDGTRLDVRQAFDRYRKLAPMMQAIAAQHGVPRDLLAMGFVESRFRNLDESQNRRRCAGIWQLDRATARYLGLTVRKGNDERLDPLRSTDAAMRYLAELYGDFGNWDAAVVAYNIGETKLRRVMRETGTKDPWQLVDDRCVGRFLLRVAAAAVIMDDVGGARALASLPVSASLMRVGR